ncbi:right-handed parallel beta-helix repeat-containing protein, partial [bacterium]
MNPLRLPLLLSLLMLISTAVFAGGKEFYVSPRGSDENAGTLKRPFRTLEHARDAVRALRHEGRLALPATVYLRQGIYTLAAPFSLLPEDGGSAACPVTYRAYKKERPVISGGKVITGWKESQNDGRRAWSVSLPDVKSGQLFFHQLWVDGARRTRARHPNTGYLKIHAVPGVTEKTVWSDGNVSFQFAPGDIPATWTFGDAEAIVMSRWVESRLPVARVDSQEHLVEFSKRALFTLEKGDDYYIENAPQALDIPGEWYLDRSSGMLWYIPLDGEKIGKTTVTIPVLEQILRLEGDPERGKFVEHLTFQGIAFSYSEWHLPDTLHWSQAGGPASPYGSIPDGGFPQAAYGVPGAVAGQGAHNLTIDQCEISRVGSYAIELSRGCQGNRILRSTLRDLGAGGVKIGETVIRPAAPEQTRRNDVIDCSISDWGRLYHSAVGIWIAQCSDNRILHNKIHDFYYSGLSVGWTWGYGPSAAKGNIIEFNDVHHIGVRSDGDGP